MNKRRNPECPIVTTLDVIGDKWSLIIIRDLLKGEKKFKDLLSSSEKITTNILTSRLKSLESEGIIEKHIYTDKPIRHIYSLTQKGRDLRVILVSFVQWYDKYNT